MSNIVNQVEQTNTVNPVEQTSSATQVEQTSSATQVEQTNPNNLPAEANYEPTVHAVGNHLSYHTAQEIIHRKILIGRLSIENLKLNAEILHAKRQLDKCAIELTDKKIKLIEQLDRFFELQLKEFCTIRQEQIDWLYKEINELDIVPYEATILQRKIIQLQDKQVNIVTRINCLEQSIPEQVELVSYKLKRNIPKY